MAESSREERDAESVGLQLCLRSDLRHFARYRELARRFLAGELLADEVADDVVMVLDEALTNVSRHSYAEDARQLIHVQIAVDCDAHGRGRYLRVTIADAGTGGAGFEPARQLTANLARLADGEQTGLGLLLLFEVMDRVAYTPRPGENRLVLEKWLRRDPGDPAPAPRMLEAIKRQAGVPEGTPLHTVLAAARLR